MAKPDWFWWLHKLATLVSVIILFYLIDTQTWRFLAGGLVTGVLLTQSVTDFIAYLSDGDN